MANVTPAGWNTSQVCPRSDLHPPISVPGAQLGPYPPSFGTGLPLPSRLQLRSTLLLLLLSICGFLVAQLVKNPPAMRKIWVQSLGWENPLEKGKATHSSVLAWRIPWTVQSMGSQSWT